MVANKVGGSWHLRNLDNYVGLSAQWPSGGDGISVKTQVGMHPSANFHGLNLLGLPGDYSPASRFVRVF